MTRRDPYRSSIFSAKTLVRIITVLIVALVVLGVVLTMSRKVNDTEIPRISPTSTGTSGTNTSSPNSQISVIPLRGDLTPDSVSIICVDGHAFLYVDRDVPYRGNPTLARFVEADQNCRTVAGPSPKTGG